MKKLLFIAIILGSFCTLTSLKTSEPIHYTILTDDYCDGWAEGYCEGWKDVKGKFSICPITPICPIPEIYKDRYKDGYNRGFKAGYNAAKEF